MLIIFFIMVMTIAMFHIFLTIASRMHYKKILKYEQAEKLDYQPKVGIFVPCKGTTPSQEKNLNSILEQDYKNYTVTFITESIEDPAVTTIQKILKKHAQGKHIVAGLAKTCCQKNQNLLAGIKADQKSEILVFCDSDILHESNWLRDLIKPLAKSEIQVTFGFSWIVSGNKSLSAFLHKYLNAYLFMLLRLPFVNAVWGGATAIKRELFDRLEVAELWAKSIVDDISLMRIITDNKIKSVLVPACLSDTYNTCVSISKLLAWFTRQILYLKFYNRPMWFLILLIHFLTASIILIGPVLLISSLFFKSLLVYVIICFLFSLFLMFNYIFLRLPERDNEKALKWFLNAPLVELVAVTALLKSFLAKKIIWQGIVYKVDKKGRVIKIIR